MRLVNVLATLATLGLASASPPAYGSLSSYYNASSTTTLNSSAACPVSAPADSGSCETSTTIYETTTWYNYSSHEWTYAETTTRTPTWTSTSVIGPTVTATYNDTYSYSETVSREYTGTTVYSTQFWNTKWDTYTSVPTAWSTSYVASPLPTATPNCPYIETPTTTSTIDVFTATTTETYYYNTEFANPVVVGTTINDTSTLYVGGGTTWITSYTWLTTTPIYITYDSYTTTTVTAPTTTLDNACNPTNVVSNIQNIKGVGSDFIHYYYWDLNYDTINQYQCCDYCLHHANCAAWVGGVGECWFKWSDAPPSYGNDTQCCGLAGYLYGIGGEPDSSLYYAAGSGCGYLVSADGS
ncbi:hypothetical protein K431DRAFT_311091 [Polychaeton citri CBS 116435]|uniref:Apple domain-containing protein n=1 Tax=Polychaeton citri CBS 116435 TaxID=1314669 RepID=A0A9P4UQX8_9PEZI|nr:hypothetical protein K431DRAFT_311091 [Polychaeton citri CBS 116435]